MLFLFAIYFVRYMFYYNGCMLHITNGFSLNLFVPDLLLFLQTLNAKLFSFQIREENYNSLDNNKSKSINGAHMCPGD